MYRACLIALVCFAVSLSRMCLGADALLRFADASVTEISSVATDSSGNVFVCGATLKPKSIPRAVRIGPANTNLAAADVFLMKLAPDGSVLGSIVIGGESSEWGPSIA